MPERPHDVTAVDERGVRGFLHVSTDDPVALLALTHGAGGDCTAKLLLDVAETWSSRGVAVLRFDLAFRQAKPSGPPHPSKAEGDRESIRAAVDILRDKVATLPSSIPLLVGGHSYGGRQASMAVAGDAELASGLVLLSYPLHPPAKPERSRTAHLPDVTVPTLFVSGTKDPFGTESELRDAVDLISADTDFVAVSGAGHDLSAAKHRTAQRAWEAANVLFSMGTDSRAAS